jgi:glycosyltransferase involved in cell wall biosynthesis
MRIAIANWSNRHVGGLETYVANVSRALADAGHDIAFWHEGDAPSDRAPIAFPPQVPLFDAGRDLDLSFESLHTWKPDILFVHGLVSPDTERKLIDQAPAVFFGHGYYGTCITGAKTHMFPVARPCDRVFGPACLVQFYPRRCGGLSPVTMWTEYRRQAARLVNLERYRGVVVFSEHMRREFVRHGIPPDRVHRVEPICDPHTGVLRPGRRSNRREWRSPVGSTRSRDAGCSLLRCPRCRRLIAKRIELVVVGAGPDETACRHLAATVMKAHPR